MKTWVEPPSVIVPAEVEEAVSRGTNARGTAAGWLSLVASILVRRGITKASAALAFLDPHYYQPTSAYALPDMERAVDRLERAIQRGETICVWGDFDVDGQTATTLLVSMLQHLGATVTYHIPVRATESHGVGIPVLNRLIDEGMDLLLTCDTGVAAHEAVDVARQRGVETIITDHHDLPESLPDAKLPSAVAVVNPKRLSVDADNGQAQAHPLSTLPGVGVAYKLAEALLERAGQAEVCHQFLDLVALGIVADIAIQTGDTRYLLQRGLEALRHTQRLGLQVSMELAGLQPERLTEEHIGFILGPRLNALGRLADANVAVEFLTTDSLSRARVLATELEGLNAQRQLMTNQVFRGAQAAIERDPSLLRDAALVLDHPAWPAGVIGIVASRLVEHYQRPAVLIAAPPGELARGSARSVEGCNITAAIAQQHELLVSYGGHPMAAGLTLQSDHIPAFRRRLASTVQEMLGAVSHEPSLTIDSYLELGDLNLELVEALEHLAPFGPGNPPPILATRDLIVASQTPVGRDGEHLQLVVRDAQGATQRVIWWQSAGWPVPEGPFDLAYTVRASSYRGQREVEVVWQDARSRAPQVGEGTAVKPSLEAFDYRQHPHPRQLLEEWKHQTSVQIWCEGADWDEVGALAPVKRRFELEPAREEGVAGALAIWTIPPGRGELMAALEHAAPRQVYLVGVGPQDTGQEAFIQRLAGLVKFALAHNDGVASLVALATATAQEESTVRIGLAWLQARGHVTVSVTSTGSVQVKSGGQPDQPRAAALAEQLRVSLAESAAYRRFFRTARPEAILGSGIVLHRR